MEVQIQHEHLYLLTKEELKRKYVLHGEIFIILLVLQTVEKLEKSFR